MTRYLIFLGLLLTAPGAFAQTTPAATAPAVSSNAVVNYSFSTNKMDNLPFDKPFVFHLTDLPATPAFNTITISVVELSSTNPKPVNNVIRQAAGQTNGLTFVLADWTKADGAPAVTTIDIPFIYTLAPSHAYQVHIELSIKRSLTPDEKTALKTTLITNKALNTTVNNLAQKSLSASAVESSNFINTYKGLLLADLGDAVKSVNPAYQLRQTDSLPLTDIANFRDALTNLKTGLDQISGTIPDTTALAAIKGELGTRDWYLAATTDKMAADLKTLVDHLPAGFSPATALNNVKKLQDRFARVITARDQLITDLITTTVLPNVLIYNPLSQTYDPNFVNNSKFYLNLDVGYAYVWRIDRALAYSGFNIYFRPIDKTIPLSSYHRLGDIIATRTSLLIGISFGSVEKANVRKGMIGNQAFIAGGGFKLNPFLKLNAGCFMHYRYDTDPLVTQNSYHFSMSPFVSLSLDLDVKTLFTGLSDSIFK